jgi:hypothetical protein
MTITLEDTEMMFGVLVDSHLVIEPCVALGWRA